jgi:hypothetical protein
MESYYSGFLNAAGAEESERASGKSKEMKYYGP